MGTDAAPSFLPSAIEPLWRTLSALGQLLLSAQAGTAAFAIFVALLALEFLRESRGWRAWFARFGVVLSWVLLGAVVLHGDFLARPAKAALKDLGIAQSDPGANAILYTTIGAASAGLIFYAGIQTGRATRAKAPPPASSPSSLLLSTAAWRSDEAAATHLTANRALIRTLTRNAKTSSEPGAGVSPRKTVSARPLPQSIIRTQRIAAKSHSATASLKAPPTAHAAHRSSGFHLAGSQQAA